MFSYDIGVRERQQMKIYVKPKNTFVVNKKEKIFEDFKKDRIRYINKIIDSTSHKKLIVAGPGSGKTYVFRKALKKVKKATGKEGLAITFVRNLVADLRKDLLGLAEVKTFHSFCKSRLCSIKSDGFDYYPNLFEIICSDFGILGSEPYKKNILEGCFYDLKDEEVIKSTLNICDYYRASGHSDSAFRVIKFFEAHPKYIPVYPLVVVDEYQDFNFLETRLIEILSYKSPVLIVGDDDQALYAFKHASIKYIRRLAKDSSYERFELPYCSRCTKVIVDAVNDIVKIAQSKERLKKRIDKEFKFFPPDKESDSERHPKIINVRCSVERDNCHYMGRFIAEEISQIPVSCIKESKKLREPTVLVIGPSQFLRGIKKILEEKFGYSEKEKPSTDTEVRILDGYKFLANNPNSRLGWRIIIHCEPCGDSNKIIKKAISENTDINPLISSEQFKSEHLKLANHIGKIMNGEELNVFEQSKIEEALELTLEEIKKYMIFTEEKVTESEMTSEYQETPEETNNSPSIFCTSFEGSKGLAAQYVFIVGMNNEHFPRKPDSISNRDICKLIVALTRTRKRCYVISCDNFAGVRLSRSIFFDWLEGKLFEQLYVNKDYVSKYFS